MAERATRKVMLGTVVTDKMDKTRVVVVERQMRHPKYGKVMRRHSRFVMHDEKNESLVGDKVEFMETRPMSKSKRWRLVSITEKAKSATL